MRRKRLPPDNRLDWRDPNMPVMMMGNRASDPANMPLRMLVIDPQEMNDLMQWQMKAIWPTLPSWYSDPSYNWGKKK